MTDLKQKRILVTGGSGFVGSAVVQKLRQRECRDIYVPRSSEYDLCKEDQVARLFRDVRPKVVIHLAGRVGGIGANMSAPAEFFYDNIRMGVFVIHYAHLAGIEKFVSLGTGCSYPKIPPSFPFKEEDLWTGYPEETNAPYAFAKKMLSVQSIAYRDQYDFRAVNLLPANLYGPRDNFNLEKSHVVPALIRKFVEAFEEGKSSVTLWGTGKASREFLYIDDCVEGVVLATEKCETAEPINLGCNRETTIKELAETIAELCGFKGILEWDISKPDGQPKRRLDTRKAKRLFGFEAKTSLEDGLCRTIEWYKTNRAAARL